MSCAELPGTYAPEKSFIASLSKYEFGKTINMYNCPTCSAFMFAECKKTDSGTGKTSVIWEACTGTLEKYDEVVDLKGHIFVTDTKDGGISTWLPTYRDRPVQLYANYTDKVISGWHDSKGHRNIPDTAEKLRASCKCGGVQFWLHRPGRASNNGQPRPAPTSTGEICHPALLQWIQNDSRRFSASICMCNDCRITSGLDIVPWAYLKKSDITQDEAGETPFEPVFGTLKTYASSPGRTRSTCSVCKAAAFFLSDARDDSVDVAVGLLNAPDGARAESWIEWLVHRIGYHEDSKGRADFLRESLNEGLKDHPNGPRRRAVLQNDQPQQQSSC